MFKTYFVMLLLLISMPLYSSHKMEKDSKKILYNTLKANEIHKLNKIPKNQSKFIFINYLGIFFTFFFEIFKKFVFGKYVVG
jgi:hypothetical protein